MDYLTALKLANLEKENSLISASLHIATRWNPQVLQICLKAHARQHSHFLQVTMGNFGDLLLQLEALRQSTEIYPLLILLDEEDLFPGASLRSDASLERSNVEQRALSFKSRVKHLVSVLHDLLAKRPIFLLPPSLPIFPLSSVHVGCLSPIRRLYHELSLALFELQSSFPRNLHILDSQIIGENIPFNQWRDDRLLFSGGWPYSKVFTNRIAEICTLLLFARAEPKKILITDADDTLWRGIVGDDGVESISWSQEPESYRHLIYQKTLNLLISEGVLVAISSKNSPENLASALRRSDLVLKVEKLSEIEASWESKSTMIRRILLSTNLLPSAAVFVDNSDFELGEVAQSIPEITCLRFPSNNSELRTFLQNLREFYDTNFLSKEDIGRVESLHNSKQFQKNLKIADNAENYLASLQMQANIEPIASGAAERAFQLLNKTNQFNLSGRRWTASEWNARIQNPNFISLQLSFRDRNCDYGIISVLLADRDGLVTDWVLSCRVFGRTIEHYFLNHLLSDLEPRGVRELRLNFKDTGKNISMHSFLNEIAVEDSKEQIWRFAGHSPKIRLISPLDPTPFEA